MNITKKHLKAAPSIYLPHSNLFSCCGLSQTYLHLKLLETQNLCAIHHVDNVASRGYFRPTIPPMDATSKETQTNQVSTAEKKWVAMVILLLLCLCVIYINARKMISQYFFGGVFNHSRNHAIDIFITICVNMWKAITRVENHFGFKHLYILKLF